MIYRNNLLGCSWDRHNRPITTPRYSKGIAFLVIRRERKSIKEQGDLKLCPSCFDRHILSSEWRSTIKNAHP